MELGLEVVGPDQSLPHERERSRASEWGVRVAAGPQSAAAQQANKTEAIAVGYPELLCNQLLQ